MKIMRSSYRLASKDNHLNDCMWIAMGKNVPSCIKLTNDIHCQISHYILIM